MKKVELSPNILLYNEDIRDVYSKYINQIDAVITDPPYKLTSGGRTKCKKSWKGIFAEDSYSNNGLMVETPIEFEEFCPILYDIAKERSHCWLMADSKNVRKMLNSAQAAGFKFHNLLYWKKNTVTPNRWGMKNTEYIGLFYKGKAKSLNNRSITQCLEFVNPRNKIHPTQKPIELMDVMVSNSTQENEIVIDPFMGSGTTAISCINLNRKFIGIEKNKEFFDIAVQRIKNII